MASYVEDARNCRGWEISRTCKTKEGFIPVPAVPQFLHLFPSHLEPRYCVQGMHSQVFHNSIADEALRLRECRRVSRIDGHGPGRAVCGVIIDKASVLSSQRRLKLVRS